MNISIKTYVNVLFLMFVSTAPSFADLIDWVDYKHQQRCTRFNTQANADNKICVNTIFQTKSIILGEHTDVINGVLSDQKRVSRTRHADDTKGERKRILQAVMATTLIHTNDVRFLLPDHGLSVTDYVYKHFEILRLTELFSKHLLTHTHRDPLDQFTNLYAYSGLEHAVLCDWFNEMRETHAPGIAQRNESASRAAITRTRKHSMESKTSAISSMGYEKSVTNETDRNNTCDVKATAKEKGRIHTENTAYVGRKSEPFDAVNDVWSLRELFETAAKQQDAILVQKCVEYNEGFCLTSDDIDRALLIAVKRGVLNVVQVLMSEREVCNVTQPGLDRALTYICRKSVVNSYEIVHTLLSSQASIKPTQDGIDAAILVTCENLDCAVLQFLLSKEAPTKPTEHVSDNALQYLARQSWMDKDLEKINPFFMVLLSPEASVSPPTQEGIEKAFLAASAANNIGYLQYFILYSELFVPSKEAIEHALRYLGGGLCEVYRCRTQFPSLMAYVLPYLSGVPKELADADEYRKQLNARTEITLAAWERAKKSKPLPMTPEILRNFLSLQGFGLEVVDPTEEL